MQKVGAAAGSPALVGGGDTWEGAQAVLGGAVSSPQRHPDFYQVTTPTWLISNHWRLDHLSHQIPGLFYWQTLLCVPLRNNTDLDCKVNIFITYNSSPPKHLTY